jgi:iron complex transport system substrate-binding protein
LGIPVLYVDLETPESFYRDIGMMGNLFGNPGRAREVVEYYREREEMVTSAPAHTDKPRVLLVSYTESDEGVAFNVPPAEWLQTKIVEKAGGFPVWKGDYDGSGWKKVNLEQVAAWAPELIFVVSYRTPAAEALAELAGNSSLGLTGARILPFPADFYSWDQPDPRWILGLLWSAKVIHPELFNDLDIKAEVHDFFGTLYGLDRSTIDTEILPRLEPALAFTR